MGGKVAFKGTDANRWLDLVMESSGSSLWLPLNSQWKRKQGHQLSVMTEEELLEILGETVKYEQKNA